MPAADEPMAETGRVPSLPRPARIIFWQPIPSPHQEAFLESVAEQFPGEVILGVERDLPSDRIAQGWRKPEFHRVRLVDISDPVNHAALASHRSPESLHVFSGFFSHPLVWSGFRSLKPSRARLAIYSEAPEQPWHTGWLKRLRGRWLAARYAKRFAFVLAVGGVGCEFFETIGFPKKKIIPFGYFLSAPSETADTPIPPADGLRFVYCGQLIHRKGIDILADALGGLPAVGWRLDAFGAGPLREILEQPSLRGRVFVHDVVSNDQIEGKLIGADWTVLPSRFDGWGMLVSESLRAGVPVICSDACGAASMVRGTAAGRIFLAGNSPDLARVLGDCLDAGKPTTSQRELARAMSRQNSAGLAAERFLAIASEYFLDVRS
jgi:glycosyltransferase involved in cell wall biosynthesis